jgi:hypothetical protein
VLILVGPIVADVSVVSATVLTDPYCPWSWAAEPQLRRLQVEFGDSLSYTFVIVGLHRQIQAAEAGALALATPEVAAACDLPGPRAPAELWRLALEWRVKPRRAGGGELWELA